MDLSTGPKCPKCYFMLPTCKMQHAKENTFMDDAKAEDHLHIETSRRTRSVLSNEDQVFLDGFSEQRREMVLRKVSPEKSNSMARFSDGGRLTGA